MAAAEFQPFRNSGFEAREVLMAASVRMRLVILLVAVSGAPAVGAAPDPKLEASRHFKLGVELAEDGQYLQAAVEFQRAYEISPSFQALYNLGQAWVGANRPVEAVDALQRYLAEGAAKVPAARRKEVEESIRKQNARTGTIDWRVKPDNTEVRIDGRVVASSAVRVGVGEHVISASASGYQPQSRSVTVSAGDRAQVELELEPENAPPTLVVVSPQPEPVAPPPPGPPTSSEPVGEPPPASPPVDAPAAREAVQQPAAPGSSSPVRVLGWVLGGLGVASLAAAISFGVATRGPLQQEIDASQANDPEAYRAAKATADGLALGANIMYGTAAALVVGAAVVLLVTWPKSETALGFAPLPGGGAAVVRGNF